MNLKCRCKRWLRGSFCLTVERCGWQEALCLDVVFNTYSKLSHFLFTLEYIVELSGDHRPSYSSIKYKYKAVRWLTDSPPALFLLAGMPFASDAVWKPSLQFSRKMKEKRSACRASPPQAQCRRICFVFPPHSPFLFFSTSPLPICRNRYKLSGVWRSKLSSVRGASWFSQLLFCCCLHLWACSRRNTKE